MVNLFGLINLSPTAENVNENNNNNNHYKNRCFSLANYYLYLSRNWRKLIAYITVVDLKAVIC